MSHSVPAGFDVTLDRDMAMRGLYQFGEAAWPIVEGHEMIRTWHLRVLCRFLEQLVSDDYDGGAFDEGVVNVPPGTGKSTWCNVILPAWDWIFRPWRKWMFSSFDDGLILRDARRCRGLVESAWYQDRFGPGVDRRFPGCEISRTRGSAEKAGEYWTTAGGLRFSSTIRSRGTGWHAHIQVVDDPHKAMDATKDASAIDDVGAWYDETMSTRAVPGSRLKRLVIMQRLHERDLSGRCISRGYRHLCLPQRYEHDHPHPCAEDQRTVEGELLCPALKSEDRVHAEEVALGPHAASAQEQQRPSPRGGRVFQRDWFINFWHELPAHITRVHSWDHTFGSLGASASWVVGDDWGRSGADYYLIDEWRDRCEFPAMQAGVISFAAKHPSVIAKLIEDKANGKAIVQSLRHVVDGLIEWKVGGSTGGKLARAESWTGLAQAGNIWLPHPTEARIDGRPHPCPWVDEWIENICGFSGLKGDVADQVDTASQAITYLRDETGYEGELAAAMARLRKEGRV